MKITKFNTLVMESGEACSTFVDRVKEQAQKLENMGEKVSNTNLLTRLKEGVHKVHPLLASNLYVQGGDDVKVVEDVIRGYDNTPMGKQVQTEGVKTFDKANVVAEIPGKIGSQKRCRLCHKRGHIAKDCYANQGRKSHNRGIGKPTHNVVKKCYICNSSNHLQAECPKKKAGYNDSKSFAKSKGSADEKRSNSERSWKWKPPQQSHDAQHRKRKHSWNEGSDNSSVDRSNMMSFDHIRPQETTTLEGDDQSPVYVMVDTGTNRLTLTDKEYFDELDESVKREMQLAKKKLTLRVEGVGKIGRFEEVYYSPEADDNLCGASVICDL